jgi:ABC-2 type transport system ATP-binding protein
MSRHAMPLVIQDVGKRIAGRPVLAGLSMSCPPGTITALLGPNGAGKTTAIMLATGLRRADTGEVTVFGRDPRTAAARRQFSLVPQEIGFPAPVTVDQCLDLVEGQRRPGALAPLRSDLLMQLDLDPLRHRSVGGLSGGQRRRLALALGLLRAPGLLLLDEATSNLDEQGRAVTWQLVRRYADRGGSVLATTHILSDLDTNADRVIALAEGRVVRAGSLAELRDHLGRSTVTARVVGGHARCVAAGVASAAGDPSAVAEWSADPTSGLVTWRTKHPLEIVARLHRFAPDATDLTVAPTPLSDLLRNGEGASPP